MTYETENPDIQALRPRLQAPDAGMRRIALIDLADLEDPEYTDRFAAHPRIGIVQRQPLRDAADDGDPEVRKAVRIALAQLQ